MIVVQNLNEGDDDSAESLSVQPQSQRLAPTAPSTASAAGATRDPRAAAGGASAGARDYPRAAGGATALPPAARPPQSQSQSYSSGAEGGGGGVADAELWRVESFGRLRVDSSDEPPSPNAELPLKM